MKSICNEPRGKSCYHAAICHPGCMEMSGVHDASSAAGTGIDQASLIETHLYWYADTFKKSDVLSIQQSSSTMWSTPLLALATSLMTRRRTRQPPSACAIGSSRAGTTRSSTSSEPSSPLKCLLKGVRGRHCLIQAMSPEVALSFMPTHADEHQTRLDP